MEMINGQIWQDAAAYNQFMMEQAQRNLMPKEISTEELFEMELREFFKMVQEQQEEIDLKVRSKQELLIKPGECFWISTGIPMETLMNYNVMLTINPVLEYKTWIKVASSFHNQFGEALLGVQNHAQAYIAWRESKSEIQTLSSPEWLDRKHLPFKIDAGDHLANARLVRKRK